MSVVVESAILPLSLADPLSPAFRDACITAPSTSWVTAVDVDRHLLVLASFHKLHHLVNKDGVAVDATTGLPIASSSQKRYFALAVHRFTLWLSLIVDTPLRKAGYIVPLNDEEMPPLDVLLVLHCYMLAPHAFHKDCSTRYPQLAGIGKFPFEATVARIDKHSYLYIPTHQQRSFWMKATRKSIDFEVETEHLSAHELTCESEKFSVDLIDAVLRQGRFIENMINVGLCGQDCDYSTKSHIINQALERYMDFMTKDTTDSIVPPLDVDVVFHTHQLFGSLFRTQCLQVLGYFPDHDDSQTAEIVVAAIAKTEKLLEWESDLLPSNPSDCPRVCLKSGPKPKPKPK